MIDSALRAASLTDSAAASCVDPDEMVRRPAGCTTYSVAEHEVIADITSAAEEIIRIAGGLKCACQCLPCIDR